MLGELPAGCLAGANAEWADVEGMRRGASLIVGHGSNRAQGACLLLRCPAERYAALWGRQCSSSATTAAARIACCKRPGLLRCHPRSGAAPCVRNGQNLLKTALHHYGCCGIAGSAALRLLARVPARTALRQTALRHGCCGTASAASAVSTSPQLRTTCMLGWTALCGSLAHGYPSSQSYSSTCAGRTAVQLASSGRKGACRVVLHASTKTTGGMHVWRAGGSVKKAAADALSCRAALRSKSAAVHGTGQPRATPRLHCPVQQC